VFRVASSIESGLLHTVRSEKATLVLAEWRHPNRSEIVGSTEAFHILSHSPVPVLLARGVGAERFERVIVVVRRRDLVSPGVLDLEIASQVAERLAGRGHSIVFVGERPDSAAGLFRVTSRHEVVESPDPVQWVADNLRATDLLLLPGLDAAREALNRDPACADKRLLVAIAAHGGPLQVAGQASGLVFGRSATESDHAPTA
jgi:hypothetical protein